MDPPVPSLDSYLEVRVPGTYSIELVPDDGEWRPAAPLRMPHHHATRLALTNLADFPALASATGPRRFVLELAGRDVVHVPSRDQWRVTYHARIVSVGEPPCPPCPPCPP